MTANNANILPNNAISDVQYLRHYNLLEEENDGKPHVGIAIIGIGNIGTFHLRTLLRSTKADLLYVVEHLEKIRNGREAALRLSKIGCKILSTAEDDQVFNDPRVQAVVIATATDFHAPYIRRAIAARKHIFCEKPLGRSEEEIRSAYENASLKGLHLLCALNRRFDPAIRSIKQRIVAGEIGAVQVIKTCARDSPAPSLAYLHVSGGIFFDCAVHDIDYVCWLMGEFPTRVIVFASLLNPKFEELRGKDFDTVSIVFKFPSGALANINLSRESKYGYDQRCEVFGSLGKLMSANVRAYNVMENTPKGEYNVPIHYSFISRYENSYRSEMDYFVDLVRGKYSSCEITGEEVLALTRIARACEQSARSGGQPVALTW